MPGARFRRLLFSASVTAATIAPAVAQAQVPSRLPSGGPQAGPITAPAPASTGNVPAPNPSIMLEQPRAGDNMGATIPGPVRSDAGGRPPGPPGCSCGDRHGVSRWWWHRTQCKRQLQEWALGFPEEFNEWPLGSSLYAHGRTLVANGSAARMVFYHYDFVDGSAQLNVRGRDKLAKISQLLPATFFPVVIERTPATPGLDVQRRATVLAALSDSRFPIPPERLVIGPPIAHGLMGVEADVLFYNQLYSLSQGGAGIGGFSGSQGFDASGLSGGALTTGAAAGGLGR